MGWISLLLSTSVGLRAIGPESGFHERVVRIEASRFEFTPNNIILKRGERVRLRLTGNDVKHGLRIPELGIDIVIPAGKAADLVLAPAKTGTFVGKCSVFCGADHKAMALTVEVRP